MSMFVTHWNAENDRPYHRDDMPGEFKRWCPYRGYLAEYATWEPGFGGFLLPWAQSDTYPEGWDA